MVKAYDPEKAGAYIRGVGPYGWIKTLEGGHVVSPGDWIIKGVAGEFYPCKPDIFASTYEQAPEPTLPPHQQRVLGESSELRERLGKLDAFILDNPAFLTLLEAEQGRLKRQSRAMALYADILAERITTCAGLISPDTSIGGLHLDEKHEQETKTNIQRGVQAVSGADDSRTRFERERGLSRHAAWRDSRAAMVGPSR